MAQSNFDAMMAAIRDSDSQRLHDLMLKASLVDLYRVIREISPHNSLYPRVRTALDFKMAEAARTPHWSVTPNFVFTVIACLAAIVAVWFGWRADVRDSRLDHKDAPSGQIAAPQTPSLSNSPPSLSAANKK
jgi:hypothetical protein